MNDILQSVAMVNVIAPFFIRLFYAHFAFFLSLGTSGSLPGAGFETFILRFSVQRSTTVLLFEGIICNDRQPAIFF